LLVLFHFFLFQVDVPEDERVTILLLMNLEDAWLAIDDVSAHQNVCVELQTQAIGLLLAKREEVDVREAIGSHHFQFGFEVTQAPD
jgi:hypothetical protein